MFKRANKVTALLVAAASIMSIVPAMATTRLGTKDGHITGGAIAFADGKYVYDGYRTDEDDNGIYYNDGTDAKEKFNDDLRDYTISSKFGTKYVYSVDNKDQYLVDLSNGKIVDDETPEDKADSVKSKLKSTLKKADRYSGTGAWNTVDLGDSLENEAYNDQTRILPNQFGDIWYRYRAAGDKAATVTAIGQKDEYATFSIKVPTNEGTMRFKIGSMDLTRGIAADGITVIPNETLAAFNVRIKDAVKANVDFTTIFDTNTIVLDATKAVITGQAKVIGDKTNDATFKAFTASYGATLGAAFTGTYTTTAGALRLGTLDNATSSDQAVVTSITSGDAVTIKGTGLGNAVVTVKDTDAKVAKINVTVTSTDGVTVTKTSKYFSATEVTNSLINITSGSATVTLLDFEAAGISEDIVTELGSSTTLSVAEAKTAIANYIATGKLGAVTGTLSADTVKIVLQAALKTKVANIATTNILTVTTGKNAIAASIGDPDRYIGYVNEAGKYIDASNMANIYVYSKNEGKTIRIKEYNKRDADYGITVGIQSSRTLAQDKDYIYALTTVGVLEDKVTVVNPNPQVETQYFIQKIAKAQGDTKDGAYLPKTVDSYQVDNKSIFDDGDAETAYKLLVNGVDGDGYTVDGIRVKDGSLYVTGAMDDNTTDHDKVKVFKIALKKAKKDTLVAGSSKKDVDVYIARKDADTDMEIKDGTRDTAITYDVDGNTWVISKGTITKITGTEKKDMYTCDRSFTHLDVYDDNNLIAWDTDTDVYTTVTEGTKVTQGESTAVAPVIVTGWVQAADGTWTFNDTTGAKVVAKWINVGGVWYYMKADGVMATGWYQDGATWYFLATSGAMKTGWLNDNGTWYYLNGSGAMLANTTVDGYVLGASGAWIK